MPPADDLPQHLKTAPSIILSVLETFQITRSFVAGIGDYVRNTELTTEWYCFLDRYAIMMWDSRDICINARFQLIKLTDVLKFSMQDPPNMAVVKAKVNDYLNTPYLTAEKSQKLVDNLKQLDEDIGQWKLKVFEVIDKKIPKQDDGSSTYRMLMKDLKDLKERLPTDDRTDMKSVWFSNSLRPATVSTVQIQQTWLKVWYEAQVVMDQIKAAPDVATMTKLKRTIAKAYSDYQPLDGACQSYEGDLHSGLNHAYTSAIRRQR